MSEMKYQKEFEEFVRNNPEFLGGNTLTVQRENYGVSLNTPEYAASYVRFSYEMFCKIKEQLEQELELLKLERDEFKKYSTVWFDKKNELEQELQKTREQLEHANTVIQHVIYNSQDSQSLAYEYLESNKLLKENIE